MPPTNGLGAGFPVDVGQMITSASVSMQVDSVQPGNADPDGLGPAPAVYFITMQRVAPNAPIQVQVPVNVEGTDVTTSAQTFAPFVASVNGTKVARFGGNSTYTLSAGAAVTVPGTWRLTSWGRASANADPDGPLNGPRWWTGATNENTAGPNDSLCNPASGGCNSGGRNFTGGAGDRNAGSLPGVKILHLQAYSTVRSLPYRDVEGILMSVVRAADFQVYWGATANGSTMIDSVVDVTHKARVPFSASVQASWGLMDDSSFTGLDQTKTMDGRNSLLTWTDALCVDPVQSFGIKNRAGTRLICGDTLTYVTAPLRPRVHLSPIALVASNDAATSTVAATGNGFIFYLNGHFFLMQTASLPTVGTVWNARFYAGNITGSSGSFAFEEAIRPPAVPGLKAVGTFTGTTFDSTRTVDSLLAKVHTVPDPYYVTNAFEQSPNSKVLRFVNLPSECIIRIYSLSGILVQMIAVNDPTGGGEAQWNLRNRNQQFVASGVYFYHVETRDGKSKIGRFTIVNFAQ